MDTILRQPGKTGIRNVKAVKAADDCRKNAKSLFSNNVNTNFYVGKYMNYNFKVALYMLMLMYGGAISFNNDGYVQAVNQKDINEQTKETILKKLKRCYDDVTLAEEFIDSQYEELKTIICEDEFNNTSWEIIDTLTAIQRDNELDDKTELNINSLLSIFSKQQNEYINKYFQESYTNQNLYDIFDLTEYLSTNIYENLLTPTIKYCASSIKSQHITTDNLKKIKESTEYIILKDLLYTSSGNILIKKSFTIEERTILGLTLLDNYTIYLASRMFNTLEDHVNLVMTNPKFHGNLTRFFFNPVGTKFLHYFPNIQTITLYSEEELKNPPNCAGNKRVNIINVDTPVNYKDAQGYLDELKKILRDESGGVKFLKIRADASVGMIDENGEFKFDQDVYSKHDGDISQSNEIYYINSIMPCSFWNNKSLESIILPNSITKIDDMAFCGCKKLKSIKLPTSIQVLGNMVFEGCTQLSKLTLHDNISSIGQYALKACNKLTLTVASKAIQNFISSKYEAMNIEIDENLSSDANKWKWPEDGKLIIPQHLIRIPDYMFSCRTDIKTITIPYGTKHIGNNVFTACTGVTSICMPETVESIGYNSFYKCKELKSIELKKIKLIDVQTLEVGTELTSITMLDGITIKEHAFKGCKALKHINITKVESSDKVNVPTERINQLTKKQQKQCRPHTSAAD